MIAVFENLFVSYLGRRYPYFDEDFYLTANADVAKSAIDPLIHYHRYGRVEGRQPAKNVVSDYSASSNRMLSFFTGAWKNSNYELLGDFGELDPARKTVLVVLHEGTRTGAPIIGYNLVVGLVEKYNVITLVLQDGPIAYACRQAGAVVMATTRRCRNPKTVAKLIETICQSANLEFAIVNSIESRVALFDLNARGIPNVCLVHEFASYILPKSEFEAALLLAGETIFPAAIVRQNAQDVFPQFQDRDFPVIPQGLCLLPAEIGDDEHDREVETIAQVRARMGVDTLRPDTIVIIAVAAFGFRKGPDLFVQCAARMMRSNPELDCHFVWVGTGYHPESDGQHSAFVADQILREKLSDKIRFAGEIKNMGAVYEAADILLLTSRLDPLPCVAIEAIYADIPIVCFDQTTGIADFFSDNDLADECVAGYLDVEDMAAKATALARSEERRQSVSNTARKATLLDFNMVEYVQRIEEQALRIANKE